MKIIKRGNFYYIGNSFRKNGRSTYREEYLGKEIPNDIEKRKELLLRKCLQEDVFLKLSKIKKNFGKEWKKYPKSVKKKILLDFSVEFTYNSNAIEGSTVTLDETEELIKKKIAPNKPLKDVQESINHSKVFFTVLQEKKPITVAMLLKWHKDLFLDTKKDIAGIFRDYLIRVGAYIAPDWQDIEKLMDEFIDWYNENKGLNPVELAARAHYKFEKIHPFGDGNGRLGRLIICYVLKNGRFPLLNIEYKKRKSYYHALTKDENDFLLYFMRRYMASHKKYL